MLVRRHDRMIAVPFTFLLQAMSGRFPPSCYSQALPPTSKVYLRNMTTDSARFRGRKAGLGCCVHECKHTAFLGWHSDMSQAPQIIYPFDHPSAVRGLPMARTRPQDRCRRAYSCWCICVDEVVQSSA